MLISLFVHFWYLSTVNVKYLIQNNQSFSIKKIIVKYCFRVPHKSVSNKKIKN